MLGESGCGKSVTAQAIMGILDTPPGFVTGGRGAATAASTCCNCRRSERRKVRGNRIAMIFQDALSALNPVFTVGFQIAELFRKHRGHVARGTPSAGRSSCWTGCKIPARAAAGQRLPAPVLRRHAPARDDRHGAGARPRGADRRRADDRARRDRAGADHGPAGRTAARARHGADPDHPRPGRGRRRRRPDRGHVRRPDRRGGAGLRHLRPAGPPVHARRCWSRSRGSTARARSLQRDQAACRRRSPTSRRGCAFHPRCRYAQRRLPAGPAAAAATGSATGPHRALPLLPRRCRAGA